MKDKNGEIAHPRWFENPPAGEGYMFERLRSMLERLALSVQNDHDGLATEAHNLLEELSIQENMRKRDFLDVECYEAIALMRERGAAVVVFTPNELRGANATRIEDRLVEFGWEAIDCTALFPHSVACEHCNFEFDSAEADYDDTLAGTALICPNCGGYNHSKIEG